ncbi:Polysaccharide monooxygenase Cel61a [Madurella mycetomatis]|uniref:lytic cellulose monooxygenase (C4-dehydrogenating) n=1 Tax=Madurella mycetomatis TaxID=100816 RepID=A0A175WDR4_9PEZI|nr:Polysaccharide monooxygenase Cel61a [Madurella mycetomatis]
MPPHVSALTLASSLLALLTLPAPSLSHSHLSHIIINGQLYHGFDPRPNQSNHPARVGWSSGAVDDGFVSPLNYSHADIICHTAGASPRAHAPVRAGDRIHVQWNGWPVGHVGPVLSYLALCESADGSGCAGVDKTALRWTKVDDSAPALVPAPAQGAENGRVPGLGWATDVLIASNNSWQVEVPRGLETGPYVLRHEIIALHYAADRGGAQNYPLCINLWVEGQTGAGRFMLDDFDARDFYRIDDPGVLVNISAAMTRYVVPGPTVAAGAAPVPHAEQRKSVLRAEGTPVVVLRGTTTAPFRTDATPTVTGRSGRFHRGR